MSDDDDDAMVVFVKHESFAKRLHKMVSTVANNENCRTIYWEGDGSNVFSINMTSEDLPRILEQYMPYKEVSIFQNELLDFGFEHRDSSSPETHEAFYHHCFSQNVAESKFNSIIQIHRDSPEIANGQNNNDQNLLPDREFNRHENRADNPLQQRASGSSEDPIFLDSDSDEDNGIDEDNGKNEGNGRGEDNVRDEETLSDDNIQSDEDIVSDEDSGGEVEVVKQVKCEAGKSHAEVDPEIESLESMPSPSAQSTEQSQPHVPKTSRAVLKNFTEPTAAPKTNQISDLSVRFSTQSREVDLGTMLEQVAGLPTSDESANTSTRASSPATTNTAATTNTTASTSDCPKLALPLSRRAPESQNPASDKERQANAISGPGGLASKPTISSNEEYSAVSFLAEAPPQQDMTGPTQQKFQGALSSNVLLNKHDIQSANQGSSHVSQKDFCISVNIDIETVAVKAREQGNRGNGRGGEEGDGGNDELLDDKQKSFRNEALDSLESSTLQRVIKKLWGECTNEINEKRQETCRQALKERRDQVLREARNRTKLRRINCKPRCFSGRMIASSSSLGPKQGKRSLITISRGKKVDGKLTVSPLSLPFLEERRPRHYTPITISRLLHVPDQTQLDFVPYEDGEDGCDLDYVFEIDERQKRMEVGTIAREETMKTAVGLLLKRMVEMFLPLDEEGKIQDDGNRLFEALRSVTSLPDFLLKSEFCNFRVMPSFKSDQLALQRGGNPTDYLHHVDSFRNMYCNRCVKYNCDLHSDQNYEKPSLRLQLEKGLRRQKDNYWDALGVNFSQSKVRLSATHQGVSSPSSLPMRELSDKEKALCTRLFAIFTGDTLKISNALKIPQSLVVDFVTTSQLTIPQETTLIRPIAKKKGRKDQSMRNYNIKVLSNIDNAEHHPWCLPCFHDGACEEENCSCIQNSFFCTKACGHAEYSSNFFRGCDCKANCRTQSCSCFAANRECDPDLCKSCGACTDPPGTHIRPTQKCNNDNISMRRHRRLLVGKSSIPGAGFGLFCSENLKKGEFISEYVGELISQEEADRRGQVYDKQNCSYIFDQSIEYAIDGFHKANKTRFANNQENPNVQTKKVFVNGDIRIGFYASRNIRAQSELFIRYGESFGMKKKKSSKAASIPPHEDEDCETEYEAMHA